MREYTDRVRIWIKPEERKLIEKRMKEAGIRNMSAYIRKIAIDGYVIRLDLSDLKEVSRLMGIEGSRTAESTANRRFERPPSPKSPKKAHGNFHKNVMLCNPEI